VQGGRPSTARLALPRPRFFAKPCARPHSAPRTRNGGSPLSRATITRKGGREHFAAAVHYPLYFLTGFSTCTPKDHTPANSGERPPKNALLVFCHQARGKRLGRQPLTVNTGRIAALRAQCVSSRKIAAELGVRAPTVHKIGTAQHRLLPQTFYKWLREIP
jgi:hypothetical protein